MGECLGGAVYRARAVGTQRDVALKSLRHLDPRAAPRLEHKFQLATQARHPNLVALYELSVDGASWFYAMELVDGVHLMSWVAPGQVPATSRQLRADLERLRPVMRQLAEAITALHDARLRHDNLKPSNVLVTPQGRVVVTDFGLAEDVAQYRTLDNSGAYMSPEQASGGKLTPASDWYAYGVMLYEALTGRFPETGKRDPAPPAELVDGIPPEINKLCVRLLARDAARRATVEDVMAVFDEPDTQTENLPSASISFDPGPHREVEHKPSPPPAKKPASLEFGGTERFQINGCLGRGGMGVVYEAFDRERHMKVALKTLLRIDPGAIYRFKQEFRALVDVAHPNLVALYELVATRGQWFFTMELLTGVDFVSHVRGRTEHESSRSADSGTHTFGQLWDSQAAEQEDPTAVISMHGQRRGQRAKTPELPAASPIDSTRLRDSLLQLAHGVHALHESGHMHRDIKPSNVVVTPDGRVVLLDFGVIAELGAARYGGARELVGTPAYMAPEQARGKIAKASDWYSVGVMLYRVLTGACPFVGSTEQVLFAKQELDPIPPTTIRSDLPADLVHLCVELLQRKPEDRPSGEDVLRRLGATKASRSLAINISARRRSSASNSQRALTGRDRHLMELRDVFASTKRGIGQTVLIHGSSGMGKSALIDQFLNEVTATPRSVVLAGRCYEREQVPYKGVDAAIDALSRYLLSLPDHDAAALAPPDLFPLAKVFPVLESVRMFANADRGGLAAPEPQELRRRAFATLRALLARIAERGPLVVFIDDVQWGDRDSAPLLAQLMRPPDPPPLLLLLSYRTEDAPRSPLLTSLLSSDGLGGARELTVGPLSDDDARELAYRLLAGDTTNTDAAATIARESRGHPYFIHELARHVKEEGLTEGATLSLDTVIAGRVERLPESARRLMEIVAVAGRPVSQTLIGHAAVVDNTERVSLINQLRVAELIRTSGVGDSDLAECYHDRIRELLVSLLSPERLLDSHRRIATAMLDGPEAPDPEALALHFHGAGDVQRAFAYATKAADRAAAALAFDRAVDLYRLALGFDPDPDTRRSLNERLGDALRNAGRGTEAAAAYHIAADGAPVERRLVYQRMAAEQLLYSGHLDEGTRIIEDVLATVNLRLAKTPTRALLSLLWRRFRLRLRGYEFKPRALADIPADTIQLIDTCYGVGTSLSLVDAVRASAFQALNMRLSLDAGEPYRISRSLSVEAGFVSSMGAKMAPRAQQLLAVAQRIAEEINNPHAIGMVLVVSGISAYETGQLRAARDYCHAAEEVFVTQCNGVAWELACARLFGTWARYRLGDIASLIDRIPVLEREAAERGDLYSRLVTACGCPRIAMTLATDRPDEMRKIAEDGIAMWPGDYYQIQHYWADYAIMHIDLYAGEPERAWEIITRIWPLLDKALLLRVEEVFVYMTELRARLALALAMRSNRPKRYLDLVERAARTLAKTPIPWCLAMANLLRAQLAALAGNRQREQELLVEAQTGFEQSQLLPYEMVCRLRRGALIGGRTGDEHVVAAQSWAHTQRVANLTGLTRMLAPAFGESVLSLPA